jgi:hypothetical protein
LSEILCVTWRVTPLHPPRPRRHCGSCKTTTPFVSSGRFRTNAQKKRLDIWLIYRCAVCDGTWNMPIVERCPVVHIPPDQLQRFMHNDPMTAIRHAFDLSLLARHSDQIEHDMATAIEKRIDGGNFADATYLDIAIVLSLSCRLRLDALLARELGVTRSALLKLCEAGAIVLTSLKAIRAPAFDGQRIRIDLAKTRQCGVEPDKFMKQAT